MRCRSRDGGGDVVADGFKVVETVVAVGRVDDLGGLHAAVDVLPVLVGQAGACRRQLVLQPLGSGKVLSIPPRLTGACSVANVPCPLILTVVAASATIMAARLIIVVLFIKIL